MGPFKIQNAYPGQADDASDDGSDFEIDSDVSDADLLELQRELKKLDPKKMQRDLADATIALQASAMKRWERYCALLRKDAVKLLKKCDAAAFQGYLIWYHKNHPRARRLNTFESHWKWLRQLYYDLTWKVVDERVGKLVTTYLHGDFCNERQLIRGMREKPVVGHTALQGALYYHWVFDTEVFDLERDRIQLAAVLLLLAYTGSRPGAIVESSSQGIAGTNEAMCYGDFVLKLLKPKEGPSLLILKVRICLDKGKRKRGEPKWITVYENRMCPAMCPVIHFTAIAFADNAFHPRLIEAGLTVHTMHSFRCPEGRTTIRFALREDILDTPIFRRSRQTMEGVAVDPVRAMSAKSLSYGTTRLGRNAGFDQPFHPYCLRREVGTELTDRGVSESQRNQILGQAHSETFLKFYISQHIVVDVQATFLGQASMSDLIKEIGKLCLRRDPNLPKRLTDTQRTLAHQHPDIISAEQAKIVLQKQVGSGTEYRRLSQRIRAMKLREERAALAKALHDYHSTADLDHMVAQLKGEEPPSYILAPVNHVIADRNWLAANLFLPVTDESFADIVETMSRLCLQSEGKGQQNSTATKHNNNDNPSIDSNSVYSDLSEPLPAFNTNIQTMQPCIKAGKPEQCNQAATATAGTIIPPSVPATKKRLTTRTCLFCFGNPQRSRAQRFPTTASLRNHYRMVHFQYQIGAFPCPIPSCDKIILDPNHFANHAVTVHKSDLGVRASIMKVQGRSVKPGTLIPFRM